MDKEICPRCKPKIMKCTGPHGTECKSCIQFLANPKSIPSYEYDTTCRLCNGTALVSRVDAVNYALTGRTDA